MQIFAKQEAFGARVAVFGKISQGSGRITEVNEGVSLPFFRLWRKPAARATALKQHFFACGKTVLLSLPALDGMQSAHAPSGAAHALRHSVSASSPPAKPHFPPCLRFTGDGFARPLLWLCQSRNLPLACPRLTQPGAGQVLPNGGLPQGKKP
jgi:hypothetical protein